MAFRKRTLLSLLSSLLFTTVTYADVLPDCKTQFSEKFCAKIGQMLIVGFGGLKQEGGVIVWQDPNNLVFKKNSNIANDIKKYHIGGVILYEKPYRNQVTKSFIRDRNIQSPQQLKKLVDDLQAYSAETRKNNQLPYLPLLITIDQEGGMTNRLPNDMGFKQRTVIAQALGAEEEAKIASNNKKTALNATRNYASAMAEELKMNRINVNFAPVVDVNINPLNPIIGSIGRSFSANPLIVADQALQFIKAFHDHGIIASLKHFPGHGSSTGDTHLGLVDVTQTYQKDKELLPYQILLKQGYQDIIMSTHVINGQLDRTQCKPGPATDPRTWCPATLSYETLTNLLRKKMGYKGVIVSDDMAMGAIAKEYPFEVAIEKGLNAGIDIFLLSNFTSDDTAKMVNTIAKLVKEGKVSETRINDAYARIIKLKSRIHF